MDTDIDIYPWRFGALLGVIPSDFGVRTAASQVNGNTDSLAAECRKQQELRILVYRAAALSDT